MAWAALENALLSSIVEKSIEPIERLRHSHLIPVGHGIFGLTESVTSHRLQKREQIETQLRAIRYLEAQVSSEYGRVPWRILPAPVRAYFMRNRTYPILNEVFDALPEELGATGRNHVSGRADRSTSPPHAA